MKSKVVVSKCNSYDVDKIKLKIKAALDTLGGLDKFVKPNNKVLLKVNLIGAWKPEKGVTTHPAVVEALCLLIKDLKAFPIIGDSSGGMSYGLTRRALKVSGMEDVAARTGAELADFDNLETVTITKSKHFKLLDEIVIAKPVLDADVVICVPKLKTHSSTILSAAVKNMFGAVPGPRKAGIHKRFTTISDFTRALTEIYSTVKPHLAVVDGIVGMEGEGPSAGKLRNCEMIIVGTDCVAVDTVICEICGINPDNIGTIKAAVDMGIGVGNINSIDIIAMGNFLNGIKLKNFKQPVSVKLFNNKKIPKFVKNYLNKFATALTAPKPIILKNECSKCEVCVKGCPIHAMELINDKIIIDYDKCMCCFCCHEHCPLHAIKIDVHFTWRILGV